MVDCLQLYFKCLSNCLESKTDPLPSSGPKKKRMWVIFKRQKVDPCRSDGLFLGKFLFECIVFLPYCFIYSVRILPSSFVFAFSLFSRFLSFVLFNGITKYMEYMEMPPKQSTHFHSSALSLHTLPMRVSCFPHDCLFPASLFVCTHALEGLPLVWLFLFSLEHRIKECTAVDT